MKKKKALITGIAGQDGSYLAELLISLDYNVFGMVRRSSTPETQQSRIDHLIGKGLELDYGDITDLRSIEQLIRLVEPDEVYNLAAQSQVWISYKMPIFTVNTNALGVLHILDACKRFVPNVRFYQASSSEMFGNTIDSDGFQRETTAMNPTSPYGCSKVFGYNISRHYRNAYKMFICNGICFNHASPRRGSNFLDSKVVKGAVMIKLGKKSKLKLGNLKSCRDWGHASDYVRAMQMMLQQNKPDDFVIASGETHSVLELCEYVFGKLDLDFSQYVEIDDKLLRDEEISLLKGDSQKARTILGWKPQYSFTSMLDDMIDGWFRKIERGMLD